MNILVIFRSHKLLNNENNIENIVRELNSRQHNVVYIAETQTANTTYAINFNSRSILLKTYNFLYLIYIIKKHKVQLLHNISYYNFNYNITSKITNTPIVNTCYTGGYTISSKKLSINDIIQFKNTFDTVNRLEKIYQNAYVTQKKREIPIIMYHRFIKNNNEKSNSRIYIKIKQLENHFKFLKKHGFETLTFADLLDKGLTYRLEHGKKFIIITVDDGYEDNYTLLFPLLKKYNFKAIVFMVTGVNYNKWDVDKLQEPKIPLMNNQQLVEMVNSGLVEIGAHTLTHPDLTKLTKEKQYQEIKNNKLQLEDIMKQDIISFAYPYGLFNQTSKEIVKKSGYKFAVAVEENASDFLHQDLYQIKRIHIAPWDNTLFFWFKTTSYYWQMNKFYELIIKLLVIIKNVIFILPRFFIKLKRN